MVFFIVIPIYLAINLYILRRMLKWMGILHNVFRRRLIRYPFIAGYCCLAFSLLPAFFLPQSPLKRMIKLLSNYWIGVLIYVLLAILLCDILRLFFKHVAVKTGSLLRRRRYIAIFGGIVGLCIMAVCGYGVYHARQITKTTYHTTIKKYCGDRDHLKIALLADLHLGYNIGVEQITKAVNMVNDMDVDVVVIAGDIFDNEYDALDDPQKLISLLGSMHSTYGTYAVYGNHDISEKILGGFTFGVKGNISDPRMDAFLKEAGITLLQDESILVDNSFYLVGRRDSHKPGTPDNTRASIQDLTASLDKNRPLIVLDHEPKELQETADAGADLDLSGHTHDGQMFPGNLTCRMYWENATGCLIKDNMYSIVTSGVGLWGPDMRIGTDAEVVEIDVSFEP